MTIEQQLNYQTKTNKMNKIHLIFFVPFVFICISSCKKFPLKQEEKPAIPVRTEIVREQLLTFPIHTTGRLSAKTESKLSFKTGGIIQKIHVDEGRSVTRGQILASLNLSEIQPKARQADLALQKAERDYERTKNLYKDSVATLEQFQDVRTALELARSNADIAKFNLE
jgi:multidrug efflux pump subunit AcrA (membrane-fusion protein)